MSRKSIKTACLGLFLLSSSVISAGYGVFESHPYQFLIKKNVSKFSETYVIAAPSQDFTSLEPTYPGTVKKSAFRIRTNYDLSNQQGWQATGITRLM